MPFEPKRASGDAAPRRDELEAAGPREYPARLLEVDTIYTSDQFNERFDIEGAGLLQLYQKWETLDAEWDDGTPVYRYNTELLEWFDHSPIRKGSVADRLGQAAEEACGCDLWPSSPQTKDFVGHYFMLRDESEEPRKEGGRRHYYRLPVAYLGPEYTYTGRMRKLSTQNRGESDEPAEESVDDTANARIVVSILDGMMESEVRAGAAFDLVTNDARLAGVPTVLGTSLRGGLLKPNAVLVDKLRAAGFLEVAPTGALVAVEQEVTA